MAEEIKTILTADSSQFATEFAKAAAIAQKYAADREAQGTRALASARAEVEALRLEASGHGAAASALREKMQLTEQVRQLAVKSGITEENAARILQRQLDLRKQIATAAQAQVIADQRAARISAPGRNGLSLPELALTSANLQSIEKGTARAKELHRQLERAGQGGRNGAMGFLAFSQAVEDSKYGIRGVLNNIPQMILGFGGSMGLAGALSLAAVAGVALYPVLKKLYGSFENESVQKAADAFDAVFSKGIRAAEAIRENANVTRDLAEYAALYNQALDARLGISNALTEQNNEQLAADREARTLANDILTARLKLAEARGQSTAPIQREQSTAEIAGLQDDLKNREAELRRLQAENARLGEIRANITAEKSAKEKSDLETLVNLTRDLAGAKANLAQTKTRVDDLLPPNLGGIEKITPTIALTTLSKVPELRQLVEQYRRQKTAVDEAEKSLEAIKKTTQAVTEADIQALTQADAAIKTIDTRTNKTYQEVQALKDLVKQRQLLQELDSQTAAANQWAAWQEALKKSSEAAAAADRRAREGGQNVVDLAKPEASQKQAAAALAVEMTALRLQASGRTAVANALRKEFQLRSDAHQLAEQANLSEAQALSLLREKARLQKEISDRENNRENRRIRGRIYLKTSAEERPGGFPGLGRFPGLGGFPGLGLQNYELNRRANQRASRPLRPTDEAAKTLLKSVSIQEEMLKIWQKIGVV